MIIVYDTAFVICHLSPIEWEENEGKEIDQEKLFLQIYYFMLFASH